MAKAAYKQAVERSYTVPSNSGGRIPADPIKFCLRFRPPTIAIVYEIYSQSAKKSRKFVHEIIVDLKESSDTKKVCEELFTREKDYLDPSKINRQQVLELLNKLHSQLYKPGQNKENAQATKAKEYEETGDQRKPNFFERKRFVGYDQQEDISDEDEPQVIESKNQKQPDKPKATITTTAVVEPPKDKKAASVVKDEEESYYDEEDAESDPWADHKKKLEPAKNQPAAIAKNQQNPASAAAGKNPFGDKVKPAFEDLDDIGFDLDSDRPIDFKNKKAVDDLFNKKREDDADNGLFADNDFGDDDDDDYEDDFDTEKEKSNQKKHDDIFNKSNDIVSAPADKTKPKPEDKKASEPAAGIKATGSLQQPTEDDDDSEPDQEKLINDQFQLIYDNDPELRQLLGAEIQNLSLEEKYQIMTAYMNGGGVQALLGEEKGEFDPEEMKMIEEQFQQIYDEDDKLRTLLAESNPQSLSLKQKYEILVAYKKGGGIGGLMGEGEEEDSVIMHNGIKFKRVQIEGEEHEFLMDEEGNIYDTNFNFIGHANQSDDEDA